MILGRFKRSETRMRKALCGSHVSLQFRRSCDLNGVRRGRGNERKGGKSYGRVKAIYDSSLFYTVSSIMVILKNQQILAISTTIFASYFLPTLAHLDRKHFRNVLC